MRFLANISYDGSKYYGFQKLKKDPSIQEEIEKVLTKINKSLVLVKGAGRTDRGVHAYGQCISFDLNINIDEKHLKKAMNSLLPPDIYVNYCQIVDKDFHARYDANKKIYEYVINLGEYDAINNQYLYNYNRKLNIKKMKKASKYLLGKHSYKAFVSGVRSNYNSEIFKISFKKHHDLLYITFIGKSFYKYMIRNMVGSLILIGENKKEPEIIKEMLTKNKKSVNYLTIPSNGLYLIDVIY